MSQELRFERPVALSRLHDELIAAGIVPERVEGNEEEVRLVLDDAVDEPAVLAVLDAHDPTPPAEEPPVEAQIADALEQAETFEEAKPLLVQLLRSWVP